MSILEIVTHCWRYSRLLGYQLSSLLIAPPEDTRVVMKVFFCLEDEQTSQTLTWFASQPLPENIAWRFEALERPLLLRRSIGRNRAALSTAADVVWFTDCDYLFRAGSLDALMTGIDAASPLYFPATIRVNATHELGDEYIRRMSTPAIRDIDEQDFVATTMQRAIGGVQIVPGDIARQKGYLPNCRKGQQPADGPRMTDFSSDRRFRLSLGTPGHAIEVPNIFRLRHSVAGRFQDVQL